MKGPVFVKRAEAFDKPIVQKLGETGIPIDEELEYMRSFCDE